MKSMIDSLYFEKGYSSIAGTDEAGRGPWAGDVYAAAVIFKKGTVIKGLTDSKKLTEKQREKFFSLIMQEALSYGIGKATVKEIDSINIRQASFLAMKRALEQLSVIPDLVLSDGFPIPDYHLPNEGIIKGDAKLLCIAAASILAKVTRDQEMLRLHERYPQYGFDKHKGYGTKQHQAALKKYGPCSIHRMTFAPLKNLRVE